MDDYLIKFFMREVVLQCDFALFSFNKLEDEINSLYKKENEFQSLSEKNDHQALQELMNKFNMDEIKLSIFFYAHGFLCHVGNLSKLFWPDRITRKKHPEAQVRGKKLREVLEIVDNSIFHNRSIRNHYEHYDSRLHTWAKSSTRHVFVDMNIVDSNVDLSKFGIFDTLRHIISDKYILTFQNEEYDLLSVKKEIQRILPIAKKNSILVSTHPKKAKGSNDN